MKDVETAKDIADYVSFGIVAGWVMEILPTVAIVVSTVWFMIRIWESKTCRWWLRRWRK